MHLYLTLLTILFIYACESTPQGERLNWHNEELKESKRAKHYLEEMKFPLLNMSQVHPEFLILKRKAIEIEIPYYYAFDLLSDYTELQICSKRTKLCELYKIATASSYLPLKMGEYTIKGRSCLLPSRTKKTACSSWSAPSSYKQSFEIPDRVMNPLRQTLSLSETLFEEAENLHSAIARLEESLSRCMIENLSFYTTVKSLQSIPEAGWYMIFLNREGKLTKSKSTTANRGISYLQGITHHLKSDETHLDQKTIQRASHRRLHTHLNSADEFSLWQLNDLLKQKLNSIKWTINWHKQRGPVPQKHIKTQRFLSEIFIKTQRLHKNRSTALLHRIKKDSLQFALSVKQKDLLIDLEQRVPDLQPQIAEILSQSAAQETATPSSQISLFNKEIENESTGAAYQTEIVEQPIFDFNISQEVIILSQLLNKTRSLSQVKADEVSLCEYQAYQAYAEHSSSALKRAENNFLELERYLLRLTDLGISY